MGIRPIALSLLGTDEGEHGVMPVRSWATVHGGSRSEQGMALLAVLLIALVVGGSSASFLWLMQQQQTRAGLRYRSAAATLLAEAGVHRALAVLEGAAPGTSAAGRRWRPAGYSETLSVGPVEGRFTVVITDENDGAAVITSTGEVSGVARRLRARVYLASPALLAALYAPGLVQLQSPPTRTFILPYGAGIGDRPWVHIAAGREVWFTRSDVLMNDLSVPFEIAPGPVDPPGDPAAGTGPHRSSPVRILLARDAELTVGRTRVHVAAQQLRAVGLYVEGALLRTERLPPLPEVDRAYFQMRAASNTANAATNAAAGKYVGNADLARKRDSLYSEIEFEQLQTYMAALIVPPRLRGVIYLRGALLLTEGQQLRIAEGSLVVEGAVYLSHNATLEITHSPLTRTLPGLVALDNSTMVVTADARLQVHGLLYATKTLAIDDRARVDVVGAVLTGDPNLSFRNSFGTVVIRYDPAVMGTPGLRLPANAPVVAWVAAWEELP